MVLIWNSISSPSTSKIRVTVFIDGFPAPRSISFTVARLMPAISAKSIWEIPKTPRRSFTTSLRFIKVYYNQLLAAKINKIFVNSKKSLINHTFCCLFTCLFLYTPYHYFNVVVHVLLFWVCLHLAWLVHMAKQEIQGEYQLCHQQSR